MDVVEFPWMRWDVMRALAALGDVQYQRRVWIEKVYPSRNYYDSLTQSVNVLYDDCQVLPDPASRVGSVLVSGDELSRLRELGLTLNELLELHGDSVDIVYLSDKRWKNVVELARSALAAMVLAGGCGLTES